MKILVLNSGSSSIKFKVYREEKGNLDEVASGIVEKIGEEISYIKYKSVKGEIRYNEIVKNHEEGLKHIINVLTDKDKGVIEDLNEIVGVGHRVVHGGDKIWEPTIIDEYVEKVIEEFSRMAPLHNPANLLGIRGAKKLFPNAVHVAVFDTAFHATLPPEAYLYAIPYKYYKKYKIRRYGFHGTSHMYVSKKAAEILGRPYEELRIITCHLGNGASIAAVYKGKSIETSMGLTPLEGLVMGTRSGDIDPSIMYFLAKWENMTIDEVYELLNKKSGVYGLSEMGNDMRIIEERMLKGDERAILTLKVYVHRIQKYIGAYMAIMGGVDVIVFTAGVGEKSPITREMVLENMADFFGIKLDPERNKNPKKYNGIISTDDSKVTVMVIPTNEELVIAQETLKKVLSSKNK